MKTVLALCSVVNKQKTKKINVFGPAQNPDLLVNQLYEGIVNDKIKTREDARKQLYAHETGHERKLNALIKRLEEKLINTLFFIDGDKCVHAAYDRYRIKNYLSFSAIQILKFQNLLENAADLGEKCFTRALKRDMIDLAYLICQDLAQYYSILHYSKKKSSYYVQMERELSEQLDQERESNRCFIYYGSIINQNKAYHSSDIPLHIARAIEKLKSALLINRNYEFNYKARNALFFKAWLERHPAEMKCIAQEALTFFGQKEGFSTLGQFSFIQKLGFLHEHLGEYEKAISTYKDALSINLIEGGTSWYNVRKHLFNANLQVSDYKSCYLMMKEAITHPSFKRLFSNYREPWVIREAYINLLIELQKIDRETILLHPIRSFSLTRFKNDVEQFSKDKRGLNIAIIIVQALFYLARDRRDDFENKIQSLSQYSLRYLRQGDTLRSNAFIKMLMKVPDVNYHPVRWEAHTRKWMREITGAREKLHFRNKESEIIPYEKLAQLVVEMLDGKTRIKKIRQVKNAS